LPSSTLAPAIKVTGYSTLFEVNLKQQLNDIASSKESPYSVVWREIGFSLTQLLLGLQESDFRSKNSK
jgi:hypothetical protein